MIAFTCPACGRKLSVGDEWAGKSGICPHCKQRAKVPTAASQTDGTVQWAAKEAPRPALAATEAPTVAPKTPPSTPEVGGLDFLAPPQGPGELGRLGAYRVLKVLGSGGMGVVLQAEDPLLKRTVALKVMQPEWAAQQDARQRFLREAQATAAIEHPHIVHLYQVAEDRGIPFLAMPFLKGEPLDVRLKRERCLSVEEAVRLGRQVAEGLAAAHRHGLIHRDIKPANLWLERHEGQGKSPAARCWVKILDFGLARAVKSDDVNLTKSGLILGTPQYMAPEQARGGPVDHRADLFSLGAVLYRVLTGEQPFKGADTLAVLMALATEEPPPVRELNPAVPPPLNDLVMRLLAKDPARRPASARAVAKALAALEGDKTQQLQADPFAEHARPSARRRGGWLLVVLGIGVLLGLAALVALLIVNPDFRPSGGEQPVQGPPPPPSEPEGTIANSIGLKLVPIQPGKLWMGSPKTEEGRNTGEEQHEVSITRPFHIGLYEVTVGQFKEFVKETKYETEAEKSGEGSRRMVHPNEWVMDPKITWKDPGFEQTDDHPVVCVTWSDAVAFCAWLSKKEGKYYFLPTEAQWEYCCRAGSRTKFGFGEDDKDAEPYAWYDANSGNHTQPVGRKKPNAWGLYDLHGNAWEWCADRFAGDYYLKSPKEDPPGASGGDRHVVRGGGWSAALSRCRAAARNGPVASFRNTNIGFRVVLLPDSVVTNSIGMQLVRIPAGKFMMGSPVKEAGRRNDEDHHEVVLSGPFYLGMYEVTVGQFKTFVNDTGGFKTEAEQSGQGATYRLPEGTWRSDARITWRNPGFEQTDDHPVVCVSWFDAVAFCGWLSKKEGKRYFLPTEAQWEYCCRAGSKMRFDFADNDKDLGQYAWLGFNSEMKTHAVGQKKPNAWGLYDLHGNAWEWTADWYAADYYKKSPKQDPPGPGNGTTRVIRGGGWQNGAVESRSAARGDNRAPSWRDTHIGFRVVRQP